MCVEVATFGWPTEVAGRGRVTAHVDHEADSVRLNWVLRQAHRVYVLAGLGTVQSLEDIRAVAAEVDYSHYMNPSQTFAVRGVRVGDHAFQSPDIARVVGSAVTEHFAARGTRVRANLDAPEVEFHADLSDSHLMVLVNTTGESLIRRHRRVFQHSAPLPAPLAASLLAVSAFSRGATILDPMAGGGTILTEAAMIADAILPGDHVDSFAYERIACIGTATVGRGAMVAAETQSLPASACMGACDLSPKSLQGMRENFRVQGVAGRITSWLDDATALDGVQPGTYHSIVSNPPYAMRVGNPRVVKALYERFPKVAMDKGVKEIVVTTPRSEWMVPALQSAGYEIREVRGIVYGALSSTVISADAPAT